MARQQQRSRWRRAAKVLITLVTLLALLVVVLRYFEDRLIFFPSRDHRLTPEELGLAAEELRIETSDGVEVHGFYVAPRSPRAFFLFSHGNAGNIGGRLPLAKQFVDRGFAMLLYDYRGFGRSDDARPTEDGAYSDGEAALEALLERTPGPDRVVLYGRSLGGGVSWELAARHPELGGIITDATFTDLPDMARRTIFWPFVWLMSTEMNNLARVAEVDMPKLLLHGTDDGLVPVGMAHRLHEAARPPAELVILPEADHNNTFAVDSDRYFSAIERFCDEHIEGSAQRPGP